MAYYKRYFDENEPTKITKTAARHWLGMAFEDTDAALAELDAGHIVRTSFALYANTQEALTDATPPDEAR